MSFWETVLQPYRARAKLEEQGMLMAEDWFRGRRADRSQGMLGSKITTEGSMRSAERFTPEGLPIYDRAVLQQPRTELTGFLGSNQGPIAQMQLRQNYIDAGYKPAEINSMLGAPRNQGPTNLQQQYEWYSQQSPATQQGIREFKKSGAANIDLGQGGVGVPYTAEQKATAGFNPQSVVIPDKNGIPRVISKEQFSQPQILSGGFATRMNTASGEINDLKASGIDPAGIVQNMDMFGVPDVMVNFMRSPEGQRYRQAQENWITANLRKESGAAIPEEETEREIKKWFPQPGDSPDVIAQKERARGDAERSMIKSSGGAFQDLEDQADMEELQRLRMEQR